MECSVCHEPAKSPVTPENPHGLHRCKGNKYMSAEDLEKRALADREAEIAAEEKAAAVSATEAAGARLEVEQPSMDWKKAELLALALALDLDVSDRNKKSEVLEAIEAAGAG